LGSTSHNVILLDGRHQDPLAKSSFTKTEVNGERPFAVVELTEAYADLARSARRGLAMIEGRRAVVVQDELDIQTPSELIWGVTTDAEIEIKGQTVAILKLKGRELTARLLSPQNAGFTVESAEQESPQHKNEGVRRLVVRLPQASGETRVTVLLSPRWKDGKVVETAEVKPLANW
jgi:hypothetical protein